VAGRPEAKGLVDHVLGVLGAGPAALHSTLGRIAARAIETQVIVDKMEGWVDELLGNMGAGDLRICDNDKWDPSTWPDDCTGAGFHEAPLGALGNRGHIRNGEIANYQCVVPSTWNAGPRDAGQARGPYEQAIIGTPIADPEQPLEILRTIHSFDPCMACGVHVVDARGNSLAEVKVQ
jgi:hydrogenase large subunit